MPNTEPSPSPTPRTRTLPRRIGIDGDALRKPLSGVGQYVYQLCCALEQLLPETTRLFVYTRLPREQLALPSARWVVRQERVRALRKVPSFVWLKTRGRALCKGDGIEAFWAGRTLHPSLGRSVLTLSTVHDLNHLIVPDTMQRATRWSHRLWFARDVRRADHVIANSEGTASRLRGALGVEVQAVVRPGLDRRFRVLDAGERREAAEALAALGVRPPYLLSVATLEPRKNVAATFRAFMALRARGALPDHQLVLAGASGWQDATLAAALRGAHAQGVRLPGFVPEALLPGLYALADLVLLPSLYEGFGMPALEARACGARVLISETPELREAAGPEGIAVPPTVDGIERGILRALSMPASDASGSDVRARFTWEAGARQLACLLGGALP